MIAATGFKKGGYEKSELVTLLKFVLNRSEKFFEFTRNALRSAKDIFNKGGSVFNTMKDQLDTRTLNYKSDNDNNNINNGNDNEGKIIIISKGINPSTIKFEDFNL